MNDIERRALIGAAGIGAIAALSKAGPLNPPAGAVTGTGRTTDEIYNKIPAVGGADGRIPIPGGSSTVTISSPGSYVLTGDIVLSSPGTGLSITSSDVALDLNGYRIDAGSADGPFSAVQVGSGPLSRVTIRNGTINNGPYGILGGAVLELRLEDLLIVGSIHGGISLSSSSNRGVFIRRCQIVDFGVTGSNPAGILLGGNCHAISDCLIVRSSLAPGLAGLSGISLTLTGSTGRNIVASNTISSENDPGPGNAGIRMPGAGVVRDNTVMGYTVPYPTYAGSGSSGLATNGGGNV